MKLKPDFVKRYLTDFFNLLFPDLCMACEQQLFHGEKQICTSCLYDLPYTDFHIYRENPVAKLFWGRISCHTAMAMLYFRKGTKVQKLIHQLKYRSQPELGFRLGLLLGERLLLCCTPGNDKWQKQASANHLKASASSESDKIQEQTSMNAPGSNLHWPDLIVPVPLHPSKERSRGYNQSKMIADGLSSILHIPVASNLLIRQRPTGTQTRRNRYNRFENMKAVFKVTDPAALAGKHILLVDDVITTGATLEACGIALLDCNPGSLHIAAIAFAE
jgi:ComF family protein